MFFFLILVIIVYIVVFIFVFVVDIDGIRELVVGLFFYGNNIIIGVVILSFNVIGVYFYLVWELNGFDECLYNGGIY